MLAFDTFSFDTTFSVFGEPLIFSLSTEIYAMFNVIEWFFIVDYIFDYTNQFWITLNEKTNYKFILTFWFFWQEIEEIIYYYMILDQFAKFSFLNQFLTHPVLLNSQEWLLMNFDSWELYFSTEVINFFCENYVFYNKILFSYSSTTQNFYLNIQSFFDYLFLLYCIYIFLTLFFSCYQHIFLEDNSIDHNYIVASLLILSEKEINAIDDILNLLFIFFFIFGWFLYLYGLIYNLYSPELTTMIILIPFFNYVLLFIPFFLIIDFSYNFASYLRGIGGTSCFTIEFIFDYVNLLGFLLRTYIQNVRFIIILLVCYSVNELWLYYDLTYTFLSVEDHIYDETISVNHTYLMDLYSILWTFLKTIIYFIYELLHTFFIVVIQLSSFLIMIFWLFSFLYTYFSFETHEQFFAVYRKQRLQQTVLNKKFNKN